MAHLHVEDLEVLDLTDRDTLARLEVSAADLVKGDYSLTQRIGEWARERGFEGILVPSVAQPGARSLVVFGEYTDKLTLVETAIGRPPPP